jgi:hypothetical protein
MKLPRPAIFLSIITAAVLVLGVCGALLLPRIVDSRMIKEKISAELAKRFAANLVIGKIELLWFPRPSVVIENTELSFDDSNRASIRAVNVYPSMIHLLIGRLVVSRALLIEPKLTLRLLESATKPLDLEALEEQVSSALARFTKELPAPRIDVSNGSAEIRVADKPPIILENVAAQTLASAAELRFELSTGSSLCASLKIEGKITPQNLAAQIDIGVQRLKLQEVLALLPLSNVRFATQGEASLEARVASVGLRRLKAMIGASSGPIVLARFGSTATVDVKRLDGEMTYEGGAFQIDVKRLDLASPRLTASGQVKIHSGSLTANIKARDVDISEMGNLALRITDGSAGVKKTLRYVRAGTIPEISIQSAGRSVADLTLTKNIVAAGLLRDGKVFIPAADLELTNVGGSVHLADGVLEAKEIVATLGTAKGSNGALTFGFERKPSPFHLDILIHTGAPELQAILLKLVRDEAARAQLLKVRNVEGELFGRLILGETVDTLSPIVAISKADVRANYEPVPFPIAIRAERLNYDSKSIRLKSAQGSVGRSTFGALEMTLYHDGSRQIRIDSQRMSLDLQQTETLLRNFEEWRPYLEKLQSVRGQLELQNVTLTGNYGDPSRWIFTSTGTLSQVEMQHADIPDRITVSRGKFVAQQGRIKFSDTVAAMSDAALTGSGTFEYKKAGPIEFELSGSGTFGGQMTQWLSRNVELPGGWNLRSPLDIAAARFAWSAGGETSFRGKVTVAGGPQLLLDAVKKPKELAVKNFIIDDGDRHTRITLQLDKADLDLSFDGELTQQTIDRVFASSPMKRSSLRGDIQVSAALAGTVSVSARGQLSGTNLLIPLATGNALIEKFSIEASGESVLVRSADVRWGESRLAVAGRVSGAKNILRVDADVTGDQVDWAELQGSFGGESKQPRQNKGEITSFPDVEGTIRLKTDRFVFERFNFSPLEATASFSPSGIKADIDRGVACGITASGRMDIAGADIGLDLRLSATDAQLEPTTVCLTNQQNDVKGIYSLAARLAGRGNRGQLLRSLKGNFEFSARDGEFIRSPGIDATFDYLNASGDFKVPFPDLDRETFPYRFVGVKGRIDGKMLLGDAINVASSLLNLSGQGKVDLELKQIDGKGLVAVLKPIDEVISRIPVIGSVLAGSLLGIPVRVSGSLERPDVTYLSPADVGAELLNIPLGILRMPLGAMRLFTPGGQPRDKVITQ